MYKELGPPADTLGNGPQVTDPCLECGDLIRFGERIRRESAGKYVHTVCYERWAGRD